MFLRNMEAIAVHYLLKDSLKKLLFKQNAIHIMHE